MAYNQRPRKSKIRKASSSLRRDKRGASANNSGDGPAISLKQINDLKNVQLDIDTYNKHDIFFIDEQFKSIKLTGGNIIVRLFHEDLIKYFDNSNPDDIQMDAWFRQIDARERTTDQPKWVATPFPYIELGVVMAVSDEVKIKAYKEAIFLSEKLNKSIDEIFEEGLVVLPKVGDVVEVRSNYSSSWFKENRYYLDKQAQCKDFVRNQMELRLNNFESYFKIDPYDLVGVRKDEEYTGFFESDGIPDWVSKVKKDLEKEAKKLEKANKELDSILNKNSDEESDDNVIDMKSKNI